MSARSPLDTDKVSFLDCSLVPVEVHNTLTEAAQRQGIDVGRYIVNATYKPSLYDLTGDVND